MRSINYQGHAEKLGFSGLTVPSLLHTVFQWVLSPSHSPRLNIIIKLIFQAVLYFLWKEKNSRLHNSVPQYAQSIVKDIQQLIRAKLSGLDSDLYRSQAPSVPGTSVESYLFTWFHYIQV
ncbi:unnamed protein product [Arabis nemorensis]|uniref:Reverse transcriptase zinc-binding domain-containing protein n=1 Tax=Arabis nemorensis TaxID=586526 RepID=A0A565BXZ1_9BRAS|nr:unnamed protein product [Arabis nemorensis]